MLPPTFSSPSQEITSQRWKLRLFLFNVSCCLAAAYFFRRHNKFCEAGGELEPQPRLCLCAVLIFISLRGGGSIHPVYTLFALFEYLVVFSNMAFHMTAFWDFGSKEVIVATPPEDKRF